MRISISSIPQSIIEQYNLLDLVHNGFVLVDICRGMYGLPQAGILAYDQLVRHLSTHGYAHNTHTPGIWSHSTRDITFCLMVDDFGIKYTDKSDAIHLLAALQELYVITTDWGGSLYLSMTLAWDYSHHTVDISMPGYVEKALDRFQHHAHGRPQHSPHAWQRPQYGKHPQMTPYFEKSTILPQSELTRIQEIIETFLFYGRAIDSIMLVVHRRLGLLVVLVSSVCMIVKCVKVWGSRFCLKANYVIDAYKKSSNKVPFVGWVFDKK
jgi:hypothetical protein